MTGLERCSLGDKWEMERGSRRQCVWTCSRGVRQSDVHKLGVSALYVQRMCVSESESWLPGGLMCLLKDHLPPTQAWSVFVKHSFVCGQKESVFHSVPYESAHSLAHWISLSVRFAKFLYLSWFLCPLDLSGPERGICRSPTMVNWSFFPYKRPKSLISVLGFLLDANNFRIINIIPS